MLSKSEYAKLKRERDIYKHAVVALRKYLILAIKSEERLVSIMSITGVNHFVSGMLEADRNTLIGLDNELKKVNRCCVYCRNNWNCHPWFERKNENRQYKWIVDGNCLEYHRKWWKFWRPR